MSNRFVSFIATKLTPPRLMFPALARPRLMSYLERHKVQSLALIMGPAGYGKTTLMAQWQQAQIATGVSTAWLTLDNEDNIPDQFLSYLCSAFKQLEPAMSIQIEEFEDQGAARDPLDIVTQLTVMFADYDQPYALFIDDYHWINNPEIDELIQRLISFLPANLKLYIGSRTTPSFSLSRLKISGQVCMLGSEQLRFDETEAEQFLLDRANIILEPQDMKLLLQRTEGWPAALQLVSTSLTQNNDPEYFIESFSGSHHSITDFLVEEVLSYLPNELLVLLLKMSVVGRFSIPLCIAITGEQNAHSILDASQRDSFLLQCFNDENNWYRFHPLVGSFFRKRLEQRPDIDITQLHTKAATWFEQQGLISEAVEHYLKAGNQAEALSLLEKYASDMMEQGQLSLLISLVHKLPQGLVSVCKKILIPLAWAEVLSHRTSEIPSLIKQITSLVRNSDEAQQRSILFEASIIQAGTQLYADDLAGCQREVSRWTHEGVVYRSFPEASLSNIRQYLALVSYQFDQVYRRQTDSKELLDQQKNPTIKMNSQWISMLALLEQTRTAEAKLLNQDIISLSTQVKGHGAVFRKVARLIKGLVCYYSGEFDQALGLFESNLEILKNYTVPEVLINVAQAMIHLYRNQGDSQKTQNLLNQFYYLANSRELTRLQVCMLHEQIKLLLDENDYEAALRRFEQAKNLCTETPTEEPVAKSQALEWVQLSQARLLIHAKDWDQAEPLLNQLGLQFESQGRLLRLLEVMLLQTRCALIKNDQQAALEGLKKALSVPQDEQLLQPFFEESKGMLALYLQLSKTTSSSSINRRCLQIINKIQALPPTAELEQLSPSEETRDGPQTLIEPLTRRELDVLKQVVKGLSNKEIADTLFLSIYTVKTHLKSIFSKMSVARRTQAAKLAQELKLID